jgi:hypothetical protein
VDAEVDAEADAVDAEARPPTVAATY